ncbi:MAG TPA: hypothetical protein VNO51_04820 [Ilumatobacteraceae bacterium]|nr:hypothetical protein [Ilumatobacteraceae bacterium]
MAYDVADLRSQLTPATGRGTPGVPAEPQYFEFGDLAPDHVSEAGTKTWLVRSQNCCVAYSLVQAGDRLVRTGQPDEYMVLFPAPDSSAVVIAGDERREVTGETVAVVPPGDSAIEVPSTGVVVRVFSNASDDLLAQSRNARNYVESDPNVAPFAPWPDPPAGYGIRIYPIADVPDDADRFGRIFRCSSLMVNYLDPTDGPRDPAKLSPHHHDDFEQISLQLEGEYVHHMRTPWSVNMADWRDDEHMHCASPAVAVIPPPIVHTSQAVAATRNQLVDIFCPPRLDFSQRPGWVLNHDEYPMPTEVAHQAT